MCRAANQRSGFLNIYPRPEIIHSNINQFSVNEMELEKNAAAHVRNKSRNQTIPNIALVWVKNYGLELQELRDICNNPTS